MIKDFTTYINEGLFDRNQSEFTIRKTDRGVEQVYIPSTKEELYSYIDIDIEQAKKDGTYPNVDLNNIDVSELEDDSLECLFSDKIYMINPDISNWNIKSIPNRFFDSNKKIKEFTISDSVTSIGDWAFWDCNNMSKTKYTGDIAGWCNINFKTGHSNPMSCSHNLYINDVEVKNLVIPNSVTSIGNYAFYKCLSLNSVTIPNSVTSIGEWAFASCRCLTKTNYTGDIAGWCGINFGNYSANPTAYSHNLYINDVEVKDLLIPNGVTSIGKIVFAYCSCLTSVTIPNSVTSIGDYAFSKCSRLTSIKIPNSVTNIGDYAFYGCDKLTSVTISKHCKIMSNSFPSDCKIIIK